jgi:hypothetical protein
MDAAKAADATDTGLPAKPALGSDTNADVPPSSPALATAVKTVVKTVVETVVETKARACSDPRDASTISDTPWIVSKGCREDTSAAEGDRPDRLAVPSAQCPSHTALKAAWTKLLICMRLQQ